MLKLPKGLKKKKKGKKSKKDQELFTEEELEQYKRELKAKQEAVAVKSDVGESDGTSDVEGVTSGASTAGGSGGASAPSTADTVLVTADGATPEKSTVSNGITEEKNKKDEEWSKFQALTAGVDSILHKTQDELDRIKQTSFYQRVPSAVEKKKLEEEEAAVREAERLAEERRKAEEAEANRDKLADAVVELSESEEESIEDDALFATDYIDAITSGEIQLAVVPDSPVLEIDEGPDPFDTDYAEKVIVGADKAKKGKKLVSLGAAVEVLTGRVDRDHAVALSKPKRKPRKGVQDLLLDDSLDFEGTDIEVVTPEPPKNLLDELVDDVPVPDAPIDLSVSLHLHLIQPKKLAEDDEEEEQEDGDIIHYVANKKDEDNEEKPDVSEFDTLKYDEDDEFAELAVESLTKKEEVQVITEFRPVAFAEVVEGNWAEFEQAPEDEQIQGTAGGKGKPKRPPPPARPTSGPHITPGVIHISDDEFDTGDDPFDTAYVEKVIKAEEEQDDDDFDFDPRADERKAPPPVPPPPSSKRPVQLKTAEDDDFDPFDTSALSEIVLADNTNLKHSLSDPDFDPRAEETPASVQVNLPNQFDAARRKSSLSLNVTPKTVGFSVPNQDLLASANAESARKPLTPYYASNEPIIEKEPEDPFDTSFVPETKPTEVELKHLEKDLLTTSKLKHSLSDPDFDPRAPPTPVAPCTPTDLLAVEDNINIKVLTPAQESKDLADEIESYTDPFDTSIAANIQPGKTELKLLENELLPASKSEITTGVLDTLTDAQELGLGDKVLTPQLSVQSIAPEDIDPFDTSIAENLAPGETEIKLLENELIER